MKGFLKTYRENNIFSIRKNLGITYHIDGHAKRKKGCSLMEINNKILEEYFSYLTIINARSPNTISEFRVDLRLLFKFVYKKRKPSSTPSSDCSFADIKFIK